MTLDVATLGEAMLRLSTPTGHRLRTAASYDVHVGGSESNVAAALARCGRQVLWVSRLPDNELGHRVAEALAATGVDIDHVHWQLGGRLGTYFVELNGAPAAPHVVYDRAGSAASELAPDDIPWDRFERARLVHLTGISAALSPTCRAATLEAARRARAGSPLLAVDVNYRHKLWAADEAARTISQLIDGADLVLCSASDAELLFGIEGPPLDVARQLADRGGNQRVVVTAGTHGAVWIDGDLSGTVDGHPQATMVDRLGAGDALAAGVIDGVLRGSLADGVRLGVSMATIAIGTAGDMYPGTAAEALRLAAGPPSRVDR